MTVRTWTLKIRGDEGDALRAADKVERKYNNLDINKGLSSKMERLRSKFNGLASSAATSGRKLARGLALGAAGGLAALAVGFKKTFDEAQESIKVTRDTQAVIKSMGGVANISASQVGKLAESLSRKAGVDDELIQSGQNLLLTFGNIRNEAGKGNDVFNQASGIMVDFAARFKKDIPQAAVLVGKALNDPRKGLTALGRVGVQFTDQQKRQIETMVKSGNIMGAQKIIMAELKRETAGAAAAGATGWDKFKVMINNVAEAIGLRFMPIVDKVLTFLSDRIPGAIDKAGQVVRAFISAFKGEGITSDGIVGVAERIGVAARAAWPHVQRIAAVIKDWGAKIADFFKKNPAVLFATLAGVIGTVVLGAIVALGAALIALISPFVLVVVAVGALAGAVAYAYTRWGAFRTAVDAVVQWFKATAWPAIQSFASGIRTVFEAVVQWFMTSAWPGIQRFVSAVIGMFASLVGWVRRTWPQIQEAIGHVIAVIQGIIGVFVTVAMAAWQRFGSTILNFARATWHSIWMVISGVITVIRGIIQTVLALINGDWGRAWNGIKTILAGVWTVIKGLIGQALANIKLVISLAWDAVKGIFSTIWGAIKTAFSNTWDAIKGKASDGIAWVKDRISGVLHGIRDVWDRIWQGISNKMGTIWSDIKSGVATGVNAVIDTINWFIRLLNKVPGVNIGEIGHVGGGGGSNQAHQHVGAQVHAHSTPLATGGMLTNGPQYLVGEGNPAYREAVIATDPRYRRRNLGLWAWAGSKLGVPGFAQGGVPGFALGGIPNPISAVGSAFSSAANFVRDLSTRALGPIRDAAKEAMDHIPGGEATEFLRGFGKNIVDRVYNWVRGKTDENDRRKQAASLDFGSPLGRAIATGPAVEIGRQLAARVGWVGAQWEALKTLWQNESGWRVNADNPTSSAYGIPQALPGSKMSSAGRDWRTNPGTQIRWGIGYIRDRYGTPAEALRQWQARSPHWYERGGVIGFKHGGVLPEDIVGVGSSGQHYQLHKNEKVTSAEGGDGVNIHIDQLVVHANTPAEGRAAGKAAFHAILAERKFLHDARNA